MLSACHDVGVGAAEHVEDRLGGDGVEPEHLRAAADVVEHGEGVGDEGVGVEAAEPLPELEECARGQRAVDGDRRRADLDEVGEHGRVAGAPLEGAVERPADEVLLAADPTEVAGPVDLPATVAPDLVVHGTGRRRGPAPGRG